MQLQLIRSATLRLTYNGHTILIDPCFAPKHSSKALVGKSQNPMVDLPMPPEAIIEGVDMVIVSHLHFDHFDTVAKEILDKDLPLFCQLGDEDKIREAGFNNVQPVTKSVARGGLDIARTSGQHGTGVWAERMGNVSGFVFDAPDEPTLYWCGDTIWYEPVAEVIKKRKPNIIVTHSSGASFEANSPIVMDAAQTVAVCRAAPDAVVVAVHMESLDHGTVTRDDLHAHAEAEGITAEQLRIPADGDMLEF